MSTYFYFECLDHDPPLQSEDISQHDDQNVIDAIELAQSPAVIEAADRYGFVGTGHFHNNALAFLREHPRCAIDVISEYGDHRPVSGREEVSS